MIPAQNQEVTGKWRMYEWSANRKLFWGGIILGLIFLIFINALFFYEYFNNGMIVFYGSLSGNNRIDLEDADMLDYSLWFALIILYNIASIAIIFGAIRIRHNLSKKFNIGADYWTTGFYPLKNIEEKVASILCHYLENNQVLYNIDRSAKTILIQGKNIKIRYLVNNYKKVFISITPIEPSSIFAKPEKYILPQDILHTIEIIEKAMVTDNFMQQTVQQPMVTLKR